MPFTMDLLGLLQVHIGPMRSTSVGKLKLKSADPTEHPILEPNYLSTGNAELSILFFVFFQLVN